MSETVESYEVQIFDDTGGLVRTLTSNTETVTYTDADSAADAWTYDYLRYTVAQISSVVGKGNEASTIDGVYFRYPEQVILDGAHNYWQMAATTGTTEQNSVPTGVIGTYAGSYTLDQSPVRTSGTSVLFTGGYMDADLSALGDYDVKCVEFFFRMQAATSANGETLFYSGSGGNDSYAFLVTMYPAQQIRLRIFRNGQVNILDITGGVLTVGTDYQIIINVEPQDGTAEVYINDSLYASGTLTGTWQLQSNMRFGAMEGTASTEDPFNGNLDDLSLYDTKLTTQQIDDHFRRGGIS